MAHESLIAAALVPKETKESDPGGTGVSHVDEMVTANDAALAEELRSAIDDAGARLAALLDPACPTRNFLEALGAELSRAATDPESVPYPGRIAPDAYGNASVKPQGASLRRGAGDIIAWLEDRVVATMTVAEQDLKSMVETAAGNAGLDPVSARAELSERIDRRCMALHHLLAEALHIVTPADRLVEARSAMQSDLRVRATADVESLKAAYLREAGGDDAHQQFAEQQWSETFADRVVHREALLRGEIPWRHLELALVGFERTRSELEQLVEDAVVRLQAPLLDMRALLVERYDGLVSAAAE